MDEETKETEKTKVRQKISDNLVEILEDKTAKADARVAAAHTLIHLHGLCGDDDKGF